MPKYSFWLRERNHHLIFKKDIKVEDESSRDLKEMKEVLFDDSNLDFNCTLYRMYRGVFSPRDEKNFQNIRHDLTLITSGTINHEFIKTYDHYHPQIKGKSFPEIYQLVKGKSIFLLQDEKAERVFFVFAQSPEIVIIPPGFGHITINISSNDLILSNLVDRHFNSLYEPIAEKKGGAFYILENAPLKWIPNSHYKNHPKPILVTPNTILDKGFIYDLCRKNPTRFQWLNEPQQFPYQLAELFTSKNWAEIKQELEL